MLTYDEIITSQEYLVEKWGDDGKKVVELCYEWHNVHPMNFGSFLDHCTVCGGDWGGMLLSGIHELYPDVWDAIPNEMGASAWNCICTVLLLLGIKNEKE